MVLFFPPQVTSQSQSKKVIVFPQPQIALANPRVSAHIDSRQIKLEGGYGYPYTGPPLTFVGLRVSPLLDVLFRSFNTPDSVLIH